MIAKSNKSEGLHLPVLQGVLPIKAAQIPAEIIAADLGKSPPLLGGGVLPR